MEKEKEKKKEKTKKYADILVMPELLVKPNSIYVVSRKVEYNADIVGFSAISSQPAMLVNGSQPAMLVNGFIGHSSIFKEKLPLVFCKNRINLGPFHANGGMVIYLEFESAIETIIESIFFVKYKY